MTHPFEKMFLKALKESTDEENLVLAEAENLLEKGYPAEEIGQVLTKLHKSLLRDRDCEIVGEAAEQFSRHYE